MSKNLLPPIPQTPIGEEFSWREWFRNLGVYVQVAAAGGSPWTIVQGGTGASTASGARANLGISTVGHTAQYSDLIGAPAAGISRTITTAKLTSGGSNGSMTFVNGILTASTQAT